MDKDSAPMKEPNAFVLINKCHRLIDEIKSKTSMLQVEVPETPDKGIAAELPMSLLEGELNQLVNHLRDVSDSYHI